MKIKLILSYGGNLNIIEECRADLASQSKISFHRERCLLESQNILQNIRSPRYAKIFIMIYSVFKCFPRIQEMTTKLRIGHKLRNWHKNEKNQQIRYKNYDLSQNWIKIDQLL